MTDAFITQRPHCTWLIDRVIPDGDEEVVLTHECGRKATVVFSIRNPEKGPKQPKTLTYPRCRNHDTPAARGHAGTHGYDTTEVE